jgi:hypothetical protein
MDRTAAVKFRFSCPGTKKCAAKKLTLKAKVHARTFKVAVAVPALAPAKKTTVTVKLAKTLAKAVAKAGKRGVPATVSASTGRAVKLSIVKKR